MLVANLVLLCVYNAFNMYCDIRWRITKNLWHLLFILVFLGIVIWKFPGSLGWVLGFGFVAFLIVGLILESVGSTAPGDTKMMMTNGLGLSAYVLFAQGQFVGSEFRNALLLFGGSLVVILFLIDVFRFARKYGLKRVFKTLFGSSFGFILSKFGLGVLAPETKLDGKEMRVLPGAVMIAMSVGITAFFFYPM